MYCIAWSNMMFIDWIRLKLPQNCQFLYCLIVVFDKIQSCLSPEQSPLSSILLAMKSSPLKSSPYDQTSVQRMLLTEENENDDTNIKEHIGYLLHIITFYYHAMETAKAVQKEDEYFSAEEVIVFFSYILIFFALLSFSISYILCMYSSRLCRSCKLSSTNTNHPPIVLLINNHSQDWS